MEQHSKAYLESPRNVIELAARRAPRKHALPETHPKQGAYAYFSPLEGGGVLCDLNGFEPHTAQQVLPHLLLAAIELYQLIPLRR